MGTHNSEHGCRRQHILTMQSCKVQAQSVPSFAGTAGCRAACQWLHHAPARWCHRRCAGTTARRAGHPTNCDRSAAEPLQGPSLHHHQPAHAEPPATKPLPPSRCSTAVTTQVWVSEHRNSADVSCQRRAGWQLLSGALVAGCGQAQAMYQHPAVRLCAQTMPKGAGLHLRAVHAIKQVPPCVQTTSAMCALQGEPEAP